MLNGEQILIVIPARYHSSRFPGKPLANILGVPMLQRVWDIAEQVCTQFKSIEAIVATEDDRIVDFCLAREIPVLKTSDECPSGTHRAREVVMQLDHPATFVLNLQGDNPLCPWWFLQALVESYLHQPEKQQVITPFVKLSWEALDALRLAKKKTPFSGTCVVYNHDFDALWFSKQIIPAIRNENKLRGQKFSPVSRHIGLYGYHRSVLLSLPQLISSPYETYEGLEQLIFLENKIPVKMVEVDYRGLQGMSGIDSPLDIERAESILKTVHEAPSDLE